MHYNRYFAHDLDEALGLAVRLPFGFEELGEEIIAIRPATESEAAGGLETCTYFHAAMPEVVSSGDVKRQQRSRKGSKK